MLVMPELTLPLDRYVETHRPLLFGRHARDNQALWISHEGSRLTDISAYASFMRITPEITGQKVHPHALRHSAATALLADQPREMATASAMLAHKDPTTLSRFYDLSGDAAVQAEWTDLLGKFRKRQVPG
jgi:site-specific recombinase XerD